MSINNPDLKDVTSELYGQYKFTGSTFEDPVEADYVKRRYGPYSETVLDVSFYRDYSIPLSSVKKQVYGSEQIIVEARDVIESSFLNKLYINASVDNELYEAHKRVWKEAAAYMQIPPTKTEGFDISKEDMPGYICFNEYTFAEAYSSTACRDLISEFHEAISQSTFSYFFQIRKILNYFLSELEYIKYILLTNFGEDYENEFQQKIALRIDTWAKMALHYTRRFAKTILSKPGELPYAELDKISKKQAAQFQAFFAIRLNAVDEEISDILANLQRDLVDNGEIFYKRYVSPALMTTGQIVNSLTLEYETTNLRREAPTLAKEILVADTFLAGNFSSIHADLVERFELMITRIDAMIMLIHEKRKLSNSISQLAEKAVKKKNVLATVFEDKYSSLFASVFVRKMTPEKYVSSHGSLDDLDQDWHPQYLLKNGGVITGDIKVDPGVKIDGISLGSHTHNGMDGSEVIPSYNIDYDSARKDFSGKNGANKNVKRPLSISIDAFIPDIIDGGIPVFDTIVSIEIDEDTIVNHEYEIIYTELDT